MCIYDRRGSVALVICAVGAYSGVGGGRRAGHLVVEDAAPAAASSARAAADPRRKRRPPPAAQGAGADGHDYGRGGQDEMVRQVLSLSMIVSDTRRARAVRPGRRLCATASRHRQSAVRSLARRHMSRATSSKSAVGEEAWGLGLALILWPSWRVFHWTVGASEVGQVQQVELGRQGYSDQCARRRPRVQRHAVGARHGAQVPQVGRGVQQRQRQPRRAELRAVRARADVGAQHVAHVINVEESPQQQRAHREVVQPHVGQLHAGGGCSWDPFCDNGGVARQHHTELHGREGHVAAHHAQRRAAAPHAARVQQRRARTTGAPPCRRPPAAASTTTNWRKMGRAAVAGRHRTKGAHSAASHAAP